MRLSRIALVLVLALGLAACEGMSRGETIGTLGGGAAGALLGSQFGSGQGKLLATLAGTLAGGYLGNRLGSRFDQQDQNQAAEAERRAVVNNEPASWQNPQTGDHGQVTPERSFTDSSGRSCREYEHSVVVNGKREDATGTACRNANGDWVLVGS
jgi:surface antigen